MGPLIPLAIRWIAPIVASYAVDTGVRKLFEDEESTGANIAGVTSSAGTYLGLQSIGKQPVNEISAMDINTRKPTAFTVAKSGSRLGFIKPSKGAMIASSIPVALSLLGMLRSDDPTKQQEIVDTVTNANPDVDKQKVADTIAGLNAATNQAKKEYQSALQMGELIDPTGPVDLNRVQSIINEAKRAKEKYDLMDTMGAIYVMAGVQGGLDMIEKGKLLSSETAAKIAKLNADKESAAKGNKDAMGSLRKGLDDLDAIMGHNNAVISAFSARSQADYQNRSLENQKMEALMRISSGGKAVNVVDPMKNIATIENQVKFTWNKYAKLREERGDADKEVKSALAEYNSWKAKLNEMAGIKGPKTGRSISI